SMINRWTEDDGLLDTLEARPAGITPGRVRAPAEGKALVKAMAGAFPCPGKPNRYMCTAMKRYSDGRTWAPFVMKRQHAGPYAPLPSALP
ncbi:hypothetical protein, partial [Streptomyces zhihengii]